MPGSLVVISAPSGGGKNSIIRHLIPKFPGSCRFVTTTTRLPRPGEVEGVDYHFVSRAEFEALIAEGAFLEYNEYAGNLYGSECDKLEQTRAGHSLVFATLDVHGKAHLDELGIAHTSIFLLPEHLETLKNRILHRGGVALAEAEERLKIAEQELIAAKNYDFSVVNKEGKMEETIGMVEKFLQKNGS